MPGLRSGVTVNTPTAIDVQLVTLTSGQGRSCHAAVSQLSHTHTRPPHALSLSLYPARTTGYIAGTRAAGLVHDKKRYSLTVLSILLNQIQLV